MREIHEAYAIFPVADVPNPHKANPTLSFGKTDCPRCGVECWYNAARDLNSLGMEVLCMRCLKARYDNERTTVHVLSGADLDRRH